MSFRGVCSRWSAFILMLMWAGTAPTARAQDYTWKTSNSGVWSSGANWKGGTAPPSAPATELIFSSTGNSSYTATNDIANPFLLRRLVLDNTGSGTITLAQAGGGGALTFTGTSPVLENNSSGAVTIAMPLILAADTLFSGPGTGTVTLSGTINDGGGGFGLNTAMNSTYSFTANGASSINFLRVGSGAVQISAGNWTLTNSTTADATAALIVGRSTTQTASFTLSSGATLSVPGGNVLFGEVAGSTGIGTITGAGTTLTATSAAANTGQFIVGNSGTGSVAILAGGVVNSKVGIIGRNAGSVGTVVVDGTGSKWTTSSNVRIGLSGTGSLTVQGGAQVAPGGVVLGVQTGGEGTLTVTGAGSQLVTTGSTGIAVERESSLNVTAGGLVSGHDIAIGDLGLNTTATVDSATLTVRNDLRVAQQGFATLLVRNGGLVTVGGTTAFVGSTNGSVGTVTVTGANSRLQMLDTSSFLIFGGNGSNSTGRGDLTVQNGGTVSVAGVQVTFAQDTGTTSTSLVDAGTLTVTGTLSLAQRGTASLTIQNVGTVTAGDVAVGTSATAAGTLTVTGAGSTLSSTGFLRLAGFATPGGTATLNIQTGGSVSAGGLLTLFGGGTANVNAGTLAVGGLTHGTAASIGNINLSNGAALTIADGLGATYAGVIGGAGSVTKTGAGTQTLTGANTYTGNTTVSAGTLILSGAGSIASSPTITVGNGAILDVGGVTGGFTLSTGQTLRGGGTVTGAVTAAAGAAIAPGTASGTDDLLVNGNLTLSSGSTLAVRLFGNVAGTTHDQVAVTGSGTITLTGSTLTLTGGYTPLAGDVLTIIRNGPNNAIIGTFASAAVPGDPLGRLDFGSYHANISYLGSGGTISGGHDVVVYNFVPVPEPGAILAVATAAGLAAGWLRRRLSGRQATRICVLRVPFTDSRA